MILRDMERVHLVRRIRGDDPAVHDVFLQFGNCRIRIQSNSGLHLFPKKSSGVWSTNMMCRSIGFSAPTDPSEDAYVRILKWRQVFEICGGEDFKAAAKACIQWAQIRMPSY